MGIELIKLSATIFEILGPIAIQATQKALAGDPDPLSGLLHDSVLVTLPAPLKSRIALEAAEAADAARV
jgi:hypothetical protein